MTTTLITIEQTPDQINQVLQNHPDIDYLFFYGNAVNSIKHKHWNQNKINICRTALLRRKLIQEDQTPETPWQLCSLYDFYTHLQNSKALLIINEQGQTLQNKKPEHPAKLLFILDKIKEQQYPEELIELIIGASLNFEVHVYLKDQTLMQAHPWDKHLSALSHYDIKIDEQLDQENFSYIINCC